MKMYVLKELVSGFTAKKWCSDRITMIHAAHLLNKSNPKERWTICAV